MPGTRAQNLQVIDPVLTGLARRYTSKGFIYDQIVRTFPVSTLTFQYPVFFKDNWFASDPDNRVKDRAPSKEIDFDWGTETGRILEYALKVSITDLERSQAHPALRIEQSKNDLLNLRMALAREYRLAQALFPTDVSGTISTVGQLAAGFSATPSNKWDTTASNPDADLRTAQLALYAATGVMANTLVLPYPVAYNLATVHGTDTFRGQMLYTVNGAEAIRLGDGILPSTIHGMKVLVPQGPQIASGNEGAAFASTEVWGKHARLLYADPSAPWGMPSVVYNFSHTNTFTSRWRENDPDVEYVRQWERRQEKVVAPEAGYVLTAVIS